MRQIVRTETVREGYRVLLRAELVSDLPEGPERLTDYTVRFCDRIFRDTVREEGEHARERYLAMEPSAVRSGWRTVRLRVYAEAKPLGGNLCRVTCRVRLDRAETVCGEWVWNTEEETMLPPAQVRRFDRKSGQRSGVR